MQNSSCMHISGVLLDAQPWFSFFASRSSPDLRARPHTPSPGCTTMPPGRSKCFVWASDYSRELEGSIHEKYEWDFCSKVFWKALAFVKIWSSDGTWSNTRLPSRGRITHLWLRNDDSTDGSISTMPTSERLESPGKQSVHLCASSAMWWNMLPAWLPICRQRQVILIAADTQKRTCPAILLEILLYPMKYDSMKYEYFGIVVEVFWPCKA
jgi:hypothetical protein